MRRRGCRGEKVKKERKRVPGGIEIKKRLSDRILEACCVMYMLLDTRFHYETYLTASPIPTQE